MLAEGDPLYSLFSMFLDIQRASVNEVLENPEIFPKRSISGYKYMSEANIKESTMTVGELISLLEKYDRDLPVLAQDESGGYVSELYSTEEVDHFSDDMGHVVIQDDDVQAKEWYNEEYKEEKFSRAVVIHVEEW